MNAARADQVKAYRTGRQSGDVHPPASVDIAALTTLGRLLNVPVYRWDPDAGEMRRIA